MQTTPVENRRTQRRIALRIPIQVCLPGMDHPITAMNQDISWGGAQFVALLPVEALSDALRLVFPWRGRDRMPSKLGWCGRSAWKPATFRLRFILRAFRREASPAREAAADARRFEEPRVGLGDPESFDLAFRDLTLGSLVEPGGGQRMRGARWVFFRMFTTAPTGSLRPD